VGKWENGNMVEAREDQIEKFWCNEHGIPMLSLDGVPNNMETFLFDKSTRTHLSKDPLIPDPMETKFVEVRKSEIPGAGEGLFLIQDVEANDTIALFNGLRVSMDDANKVSVHRDSSHKVWNDWHDEDEMLDITPEYRSVDAYKATLSHKINFSKAPNVHYDFIFHPRFGEIRSVRTMVPLKAGTELTSIYAKMADDFTFLKQIINDYHTYYKLDAEEKVDFLGEMKNTYQVTIWSVLTLTLCMLIVVVMDDA